MLVKRNSKHRILLTYQPPCFKNIAAQQRSKSWQGLALPARSSLLNEGGGGGVGSNLVLLASRASWMMKLIAIEGSTGVKKCYRGKDDLIFVVGERVWGEKVPSLSALL